MTSIHQLQALVWGGRLESITPPSSEQDTAHIRFLTAEGCQKFFDDTVNGIEVPGNAKAVVTVEKTNQPNSVNDMLRNCAEGDASRCVRAWDAEEDWSDAVLQKLAAGTNKIKRTIDCIKRGKNEKGVSSR